MSSLPRTSGRTSTRADTFGIKISAYTGPRPIEATVLVNKGMCFISVYKKFNVDINKVPRVAYKTLDRARSELVPTLYG